MKTRANFRYAHRANFYDLQNQTLEVDGLLTFDFESCRQANIVAAKTFAE